MYDMSSAALSNLDYVRLHGKEIKVTASKHSVVQLPKEGTVVGDLMAFCCCWAEV